MTTEIRSCTSFAIPNITLVQHQDSFLSECLRVDTPLEKMSKDTFIKGMKKDIARYGYLLNQGDETGSTILHYAAWAGNESVVRAIFEKCNGRKELLSLGDTYGCTALHLATALGHLSTIHTLISLGYPINLMSTRGRTLLNRLISPGSTALHVAIRSNSYAAMFLFRLNGGVNTIQLCIDEQAALDKVDRHLAQKHIEADGLIPTLDDIFQTRVPIEPLRIIARYTFVYLEEFA